VSVIDPKTFALPLDAYQPTAAERTSIQQAQNLMFVRCMQKFGFTIDVPAARALPFATNEQRYGVTDAQQAATYGYHVARPQNVPPAREPALSPAAAAVADGNRTDDYADLRVPDGGCVAEAKRLLSAGAPSVPNEYLAQKLAMESFAQSKADSRVLAKFREWSACMKTAGYTYATPTDANDDVAFRSPDPTAAEIAVAQADVRCKEQVGLISLWAAVETAYQTRAVERNAEALEKLRSLLTIRVANATRLTAAL
jgi:hypothetical protein